VLSERITISLVKSAKAPARKAENQAPEAKVQATAPVDRNLAELPEYQKLLEKVFRTRRERLRFSALVLSLIDINLVCRFKLSRTNSRLFALRCSYCFDTWQKCCS